MESVHARGDKIGYQRPVTAAAMHHYFQAIGVSEINQAFDGGMNESPVQIHAQKWSGLSSKVVSNKKDINEIGRFIKDVSSHLDIVIGNLLEYRFHERGVIIHFVIEILMAQQIDNIVPERRPITAEYGIFPVPGLRIGPDPARIHPVGIRPGIGMDFIQGCLFQRMSNRLPVAETLTFHAENRTIGGLRMG